MASTTQTTNYGLPLYQSSDRPAWTDTNTPFNTLDTAVKTASDNASSAADAVSTLTTSLATLNQTVSGHTTELSTLTTAVASAATAQGTSFTAHGLNTATDVQTAIQNAATAAINSYDNTNSGMSAANVQDAIDEIAASRNFTSVTSVTSDASSVYSTIFNTLFTALNTAYKSGDYKEFVLKITAPTGKTRYCHLNEALADSNYCFDYVEYAGTSVYTYALMLKSAGSERRYITVNSAGTVTSTDGSSGTPGEGSTYEILAR